MLIVCRALFSPQVRSEAKAAGRLNVGMAGHEHFRSTLQCSEGTSGFATRRRNRLTLHPMPCGYG